jgi:hypothetical protein
VENAGWLRIPGLAIDSERTVKIPFWHGNSSLDEFVIAGLLEGIGEKGLCGKPAPEARFSGAGLFRKN